MKEERESFFHIVWATYCSRVSQRAIRYNVKTNEALIFDSEMEVEVTKIMFRLFKSVRLKVYAFNICTDHIHLLIKCFWSKRDNIIGAIKGASTRKYKRIIG